MKLLLAILLLAGVASGQCLDGQCQPYAPLVPIERPEDQQPSAHAGSLTRIFVANGGSQSKGSGVLTERYDDGSGLVLTAAHVIADGRRGGVRVWFQSGETRQASVVLADSIWDVAALHVADVPAELPVAPLADAAPQIGDVVEIAGYGPSGRGCGRRGRVVSFASPAKLDFVSRYGGRQVLDWQGDTRWLVVSTPARPGDSGGPIYTGSGRLAGVLWGSGGSETTGTCCTRLKLLLAGLRERLGRRLFAGRPPKIELDPQPEPGPAPAPGPVSPPSGPGAPALDPEPPAQPPERPRVEPPASQPAEKPAEPSTPSDGQPGAVPSDPAEPAAGAIITTAGYRLSDMAIAAGVGALGLGGPLGLLALWLGKRLGRRAVDRVAGKVGARIGRRTEERRPSDGDRGTEAPAAPPSIVERPAPAAPAPRPGTRYEFDYVEVPSGNRQLWALNEALMEMVRRNPGSRTTVDTIRAYAAQYESGYREKELAHATVS